MDLSETIAPTSDQLDAVDLLGGPRTFTIEKVSAGNAEQPVNIKLAEFPRVWRPGKSMRRVLVACWGPDASTYVGRRVTLFCDTSVRFGGQEVGGTRISHLSHIEKSQKVALLVTRGKSAMYVVQPLVEAPAAGDKAAEPRATQAQLTRIGEQLGEVGVTKREDILPTVSTLLGRPLVSSAELTKADAEWLVGQLNSVLAEQEPAQAFDAWVSEMRIAAQQSGGGES
jgi:hypothetical protein